MLVVLIAAFTTIYGLSALLMNADELTSSQAWLYHAQSKNFAASCVTNAMNKLRNNSSVSGNVNLSTSNVNCVSTISGSGNTRTIIASATATDAFGSSVVERANVNVNINTNPFTITQYRDILD